MTVQARLPFCSISTALVLIMACGGQITPVRAQSSLKNGAGQPETVAPRDVRSKNFLVHTDLNDKDADELLERLETMLRLISSYWGQPNRKVIECYVVKDLSNWSPSAFHPVGLESIRNRAGVTHTTVRRIGRRFEAKSVVYAFASRGTPQHEAVHAYCGQTFGRTGPLWYAEGMAEMGNYWQEDDPGVNCHQAVVRYLHSTEPKSLNDIVNAKEVTGDSWKNYAWRWALCHLLANNPNYRERFRPLGLAFLTGRRASFERTYGNMAEEISFEYLFFLEHFDIGYRADLCFWDWKTRYRTLRGASRLTASIKSQGGWQASRCRVKAGTEYEYAATGTWRVGKDADQVDADGARDGTGRLVGAIFDDREYELSKPFELGTRGTFKADSDGQLVLRCREPWQQIDEHNSGHVSFRIAIAGQDRPFRESDSADTDGRQK